MLNLNGQYQLHTNVSYGDKSLSHRALILAALSSGKCIIRNLSLCSDVMYTANCLMTLGAKITISGTTATVIPIKKKPSKEVILNCGNSGTTARLLAGVVAGLDVKARFVGDKSLMKRPMDRVIAPLEAMGAEFKTEPDCLFVSCGGALKGTTIEPKVDSAQVKSAVLLAGLFADGETHYVEKNPTRNHTELMLDNFGASIFGNALNVGVKKSSLIPFELDLPNDPSSAAYLVALALLKGEELTLPNVLLSDRRLGFYRILQRSGANISFANIHTVCGERVGDIVVKPSVLKPIVATELDVSDGIDEVPLLATVALTVKGKHLFKGVTELQNKECDRVEAIKHIVSVCNQKCSFNGKSLRIVSDGKLEGGKSFVSFDDHRIAMCEVVLSLYLGGGNVDKTPFEVSFPQFLPMLGVKPLRLGLIGQHVYDSKSPLLMAHLAKNAGVCCSYDTVELPANISDEELLNAVNSFDGLNITTPFKIRVADLLKTKLTSLNTVGKNIAPQSTDGYGVLQALHHHDVDPRYSSLWIIGAGGSAEACVHELVQYGCKMQVFNRTEEKAKALSLRYGLQKKVAKPIGVLSFVPECEFEQSLTLPESCEYLLVADYKGRSNLAEQADSLGIPVIGGLEMLYYQGAKSFSLWTNTPAQDDYDGFAAVLPQEA
ncbi:MAG: hypothetical protein J1F65_05150 [Clostridiales bacterium]|nr:hypothetical protein [Clostridiales bacterium]